MRRSSLDRIDVAISREIDSQFDSVKIVADNIAKVVAVADLDVSQVGSDILVLNQDLQEIKDEIAAGGLIGEQGVQGEVGHQGIQGVQGIQGLQGVKGDIGYTIKPVFAFSYDPTDGDINVEVTNVLYSGSEILNEFGNIQPREV